MAKKPSLGRQKIKIAKIETKNHLQVTFSKRRFGLFKKASELVTLCGVDIAIIVSSPGGKIFSFGHPNIDFIMNKFLSHSLSTINFAPTCFAEPQLRENFRKLDLQLMQVLNELEKEAKKGEILDNMRKEGAKCYWWRAPINDLGINELEQVRASMEELKTYVINESNKYLVEVQTNMPCFNSFEKSNDQFFDFSANSHLEYLGYGQGVF